MRGRTNSGFAPFAFSRRNLPETCLIWPLCDNFQIFVFFEHFLNICVKISAPMSPKRVYCDSNQRLGSNGLRNQKSHSLCPYSGFFRKVSVYRLGYLLGPGRQRSPPAPQSPGHSYVNFGRRNSVQSSFCSSDLCLGRHVIVFYAISNWFGRK